MRKIDKIILHCSATPEGRDVNVSDIRKWHLDAGYSDIGYHYIINLNGEVKLGRDIALPGAHTKGQNQTSIGVCYVGGCDSQLNPKDTLNTKQKQALINLIKQLRAKYGNIPIFGHYEFAKKSCPSLDVPKFIKENKL